MLQMLQYLPPRVFGAAGDNKYYSIRTMLHGINEHHALLVIIIYLES